VFDPPCRDILRRLSDVALLRGASEIGCRREAKTCIRQLGASSRAVEFCSDACSFWIEPLFIVIASDSEAIQTKRPPQSLSLDCFLPDLIRGLLAMTAETIRLEHIAL